MCAERNVADGTHFNKMLMTIVFLVRSAQRYARRSGVEISAEIALQQKQGYR